jgi:hypothetical protein
VILAAADLLRRTAKSRRFTDRLAPKTLLQPLLSLAVYTAVLCGKNLAEA